MGTRLLTARQAEVLKAAVVGGYYDFPRKKTLSALALEAGEAPASLSEVLRLAEKKVLLSYVYKIEKARAIAKGAR